ncbi:unnamed protein product [Didymodactylos carnosus]|uniref:Integrase catalytic domain-containing protein n=1 Tax=Didymodactylos carnosus TaxID=1234261 RepID=A0A813XCC8_9BILA|nr:unnamed protein product [Didymodactylos carnosus]CAF0869531.1 unnamed protein product [Didymodactylos carnosus]CAF3570350.1 unnamed protein product [Didymodactylos carnosus]CAF3656952.1 unnamed protein product [Didymodactylos carnosus]
MSTKRDAFIKTIEKRRSVYSQERLNQILQEALLAKDKEPGDRTAKDYRRIKRFDIVEVHGKKRLVASRTDDEKEMRFFVSIEEMFDIIDFTHKKMNHGGRDRLWPILSKQYANIPREVIQTYLKMCDYCVKRRKRLRVSTEEADTEDVEQPQQHQQIKHEHDQCIQNNLSLLSNATSMTTTTPVTSSAPISSTHSVDQHNTAIQQVYNSTAANPSYPTVTHLMNRLCEYDMIDLQNAHDGEYFYVLVYQDYLTKFTQLRPLKNKAALEVATNLMDIFCIFGPPLVLQSNVDLQIENNTVQQTLEAVWPGIRLFHDDSTQSRDTTKLRNEQIRSMIAAWMFVNNNPRWSYGLKFVQLTLNSNQNLELKRSPYEAMFKTLPVLRPATVTLSTDTQPKNEQQVFVKFSVMPQTSSSTSSTSPSQHQHHPPHTPTSTSTNDQQHHNFVTPNVNILSGPIDSDMIKEEM